MRFNVRLAPLSADERQTTKNPRFPEGFLLENWSGKEDSNLRPLPPEDSALPG